ncbi:MULTISPECIES: hypothetical protein [Haloferax]|uniref:Glycosyltransferase RgtA/B/C/D-like domain-containing protein n=1 Tax=Haloferax marinum TaxID=2666143 RepID=A0A6A8GC74_9EURY|nr:MULTISPECIES: hypothetical protein [Haloferax]KAB1191265.1 hypothetical protein Hfx1150_16455 [Haloferax sp. CBA1150]MRW98158.1 hypothetical protein [Haloferax marinum]
MSVFSIVALPVIRGYYFIGTGDSLTHLGWVRDVVDGETVIDELLYPGIHSFAILLSDVTGYSPERSLMLVVLSFVALAFVLVPLIAFELLPREDTIVIAAFSGFLLLPINTISTHLAPHTFSQAMLFSSLGIYLFLLYLTRADPGKSRLRVSSFGALLVVVGVATVLYHPMQALNLFVLLFAASVLQVLARWRDWDSAIRDHKTMYVQTGVLGIAFLAWTSRRDAFWITLDAVVRAAEGYLSGAPPTAAGSTVAQGASLQAIGAGLPEIFAKVFLVSFVYVGLMGILVLAVILHRLDDLPETDAKVRYLTLGAVGTLPFVVVFILGDIGELHFRLLGYLMLIATAVGSVTIVLGLPRLASSVGTRTTHVAVALLLLLLLPTALAAAFPSPYIYQPNQHVTQTELDGYGQAFELHDEALEVAAVRQGPWRYNDAVFGTDETPRDAYDRSVPTRELDTLNSTFAAEGYLAVTEHDREREIRAYKELRYSQAEFDSLDARPGVNQVVSNGGFTLYFVEERALNFEDVDETG